MSCRLQHTGRNEAFQICQNELELEADLCTALICIECHQSFRATEFARLSKAIQFFVWSNGRGERGCLLDMHLSAELPAWLPAVRGVEADEERYGGCLR